MCLFVLTYFWLVWEFIKRMHWLVSQNSYPFLSWYRKYLKKKESYLRVQRYNSKAFVKSETSKTKGFFPHTTHCALSMLVLSGKIKILNVFTCLAIAPTLSNPVGCKIPAISSWRCGLKYHKQKRMKHSSQSVWRLGVVENDYIPCCVYLLSNTELSVGSQS